MSDSQTPTAFQTALDALESGDRSPAACSTEAAWYDAWQTENVGNHDSLAVALIGGALADRLAWVFHAGYQGMMRYAFPFCPKAGWASYLVAEDKTGEYPGTSITKSDDHATLSGFKSWVAAAEHVDHLVVRVLGPGDDVLAVVESTAPGVKLSSRDRPGFLPDLSQGFAAFEDVVIGGDRMFTDDDLPRNFAHSEPHHVLTALNAFMVSHALGAGGDTSILDKAGDALRLAGDLVERGAVDDEFFLGIADLDAATTATAGRFEAFIETRDPDLFQRWQSDRGLVNMFSRGLQKRARWLRDD